MPPFWTRRSLRPSIDGLESRRLLANVGAGVLAFAEARVGTQVGDGECATLADQAIRAAGGVSFDRLGPTGPDADYVWGRPVARLTRAGGSTAAVRPGDVVQFRNVLVRIQTRTTAPDGSTWTSTATASYAHHTAIVEYASAGSLTVLQQNVGSPGTSAQARRTVQEGVVPVGKTTVQAVAPDGATTVVTSTMLGGWMRVYRPHD